MEEQHKLPLTGEPELGLVWPMYKWASGRHLQDVLEGTELAAGDFVRWAKQVIDLLDQLAKVPDLDPGFGRLCIQAIDASAAASLPTPQSPNSHASRAALSPYSSPERFPTPCP